MKVRSAILTEMSGKIGGAVASTSRGGIQYFRKLVIPSNPRTLLQTAIRGAVASASAFWKSNLDDAQREAWWDTATGAQTGSTLFARVNQPRIYCSNAGRYMDETGGLRASPPDTVLEVPPASYSNDFSLAGQIVIDDSANTLIVDAQSDDQTWYLGKTDAKPALIYIYASHQQSSSRLSRQHPYRLVGCIALVAAEVPSDISAAIDLASLGLTTSVGEVMYVKIFAQSPLGGLSVPTERRVVITA